MRKIKFPNQAGGYPEAGYSPVQANDLGNRHPPPRRTRGEILHCGWVIPELDILDIMHGKEKQALLSKIYMLNT
jgi:hypothetical protein